MLKLFEFIFFFSLQLMLLYLINTKIIFLLFLLLLNFLNNFINFKFEKKIKKRLLKTKFIYISLHL